MSPEEAEVYVNELRQTAKRIRSFARKLRARVLSQATKGEK
jgi:hypothetical protein